MVAPYQALVSAPYECNLRLKNVQRIAAVDFMVADLEAQYPAAPVLDRVLDLRRRR